MSDLIVKDNALMNASYNLDLVEQRLILLAILEARSQAKELTQMTLLRFMQRVISINLAYTEQRHIKLWKMLLRTYLHVNLATKKNENVDERILQVDGYHKLLTLTKRQRLRLFLLLRLFHWLQDWRNSLPSTILSRLAVYLVPMLFVCMNYWFVGVAQENACYWTKRV